MRPTDDLRLPGGATRLSAHRLGEARRHRRISLPQRSAVVSRLRERLLRVAIGCCSLMAATLRGADTGRMYFHIPPGNAAQTLPTFARQSGVQLVFLVDNVASESTARVEGRFAAVDALKQMLAGTNLTVHRDQVTGAMIVARRTEPPVPASRTSPPPPARTSRPADDIVRMPQFTVSTTAIDRYRSADAVSAVRVRASLIDTPSSISVISRDVIDDLSPARLFDVTRYLAGVEEGRGIQFADRQIIRGFESNGRTVDNFFQSGADNFDEAMIERIEVSKGPNAILAPAGVPGGSINVITKSPLFSPHRSLTTVVGLFNAQKATVDMAGPMGGNGQLAYRVVASAQDSREYWAADARLRGKVLAPMLTWQITPDTRLTVKLIGAEHWEYREPGLILDPRVGYDTATPILAPGFSYRSRNGIQPWSHVGTHSADGFLLLTSNLAEGVALRFAANGRYYFEDSTQEFFSTPTFNNRYNPFTGILTQDYTWAPDSVTGNYAATYSPLFDPTAIPVRGDTQRTTVTTANFQADLAARRRLGAIGSQTVVGVALSHFDSSGRGYAGLLPPLDLTDPERLVNPVWSSTPYYDLRGSQSSQYTYVDQQLTFLDDRLQLAGGLLHYGVYARNQDRLTPATSPSILDDTRWLRLGSVLLKPRRNVSLYYTHSTNSTPVIANTLPLWRDGVQDEFGAKSEFVHERLSLAIAHFRIRQTNVTVPNPDHQTDPNAPEQLISNLGDQGWEFELTGGLTPNLSVVSSYTRLRLRDSLGRPVRAVADENAALLLNYRFRTGPLKRLSCSAGVVYAGDRPGDATSVNFTPLGVPTRLSFRIPAYYVTNLGAAYKYARWQFRLNLDNVLDERNRLQQAGGRVSGTGLTTATGFNARFTTTVEF